MDALVNRGKCNECCYIHCKYLYKIINTVYHYHGAPVKYVTIFSDKYFTGALKNLY